MKHDKISPVSYTYIGGFKLAWNAEYLNFFDTADLKWMDLDEFGTIDITLPFSEIPYDNSSSSSSSSESSSIPLDEQPNVETFHPFDDFPPESGSGGNIGEKIVVFHNRTEPPPTVLSLP